MLNPMGSFSLLILTLLFTYSKGQLKPYICSECAKQFENFEAYARHFGKVPPDHHHDSYWHHDPMKYLHLWHVQHSSSPSSSSASTSSKHYQHHALYLFFNPPTPAQQELYFKTYCSEAEEAYKHKKENWDFDYFKWGSFFKYDPDEPNKHIPDPGKIHQIKGDGHCLFRAISYAMMGTEDYHYLIRENTGRYLNSDAGVVEHGDFEDIINTARVYKVSIVVYFEKEDSTKGEWLYFGPESENEVGKQASYNPAHPTIPLVLQSTGRANNHYNVIKGITELN